MKEEEITTEDKIRDIMRSQCPDGRKGCMVAHSIITVIGKCIQLLKNELKEEGNTITVYELFKEYLEDAL